MAADTFTIVPNGLFYDLRNDRTGLVEVELIDCIGDARNYKAEYTARAIEAEAAEQAALEEQHADYMAECEMLDRVYDEVRRKLDRDLPDSHPKNRAIRQILEAIDSIGRPTVEMAAAA